MLKITNFTSHITLKNFTIKFSKKKNEICRKDIENHANIISVHPECMVKILTKIKYFKKRKPERERWKNLGAPRSLTLRVETAAPAHAHAQLQSPDFKSVSKLLISSLPMF